MQFFETQVYFLILETDTSEGMWSLFLEVRYEYRFVPSLDFVASRCLLILPFLFLTLTPPLSTPHYGAFGDRVCVRCAEWSPVQRSVPQVLYLRGDVFGDLG